MATTEEKATSCCAPAVPPVSTSPPAGVGGAKAAVVEEWAVDENQKVTANAKASSKGVLRSSLIFCLLDLEMFDRLILRMEGKGGESRFTDPLLCFLWEQTLFSSMWGLAL